jgi:hypothetical protein
MVGSSVLALVVAPACAIGGSVLWDDYSIAIVPCCLSVLVLLAGLMIGKVRFLG